MRLRRQFAFVSLFLMFQAMSVLPGQALKSPPLSVDSSTIIAWRLPSKIVLRGNVTGLDRLQKIAGEIALQSDSKLAGEGEPTPLMQAAVETLSAMQAGYVEILKDRISVIGVADAKKILAPIAKFKQQASQGRRVSVVQIGSSDQPPVQWAAYRYKDDFGTDTVELLGSVVDEITRAKLVGIARSASNDTVVVDKMSIQPTLLPNVSSGALTVLAQLASLNDGFVWLYENKLNVLASSFDHSVTDRKNGCAALINLMPKGIECGIINIVQQQRSSRGEHRRGPDQGPGSGGYFSSTTPFVAADPSKVAQGNSIDESMDPRTVDIMFATLRKLEEADSALAPTYSGERNQTLNYGRARVRIPEDHKIGRIEFPHGFSIFGIQLTKGETDPKKHFILRSRQPLTLDQWDSLIDSIGPNDAVVFVHGFNTSFDNAVFRFAQIVWDLQYKNKTLPVLFSWASKGAVMDYQYDRESALAARDSFLDLLANLRDRHKISTVHIIAHSMGNFLVLEALSRLAAPPVGTGQLIMAAPDVDRDQFVQAIPKVKQFFRGLTLYASSADKALRASETVAGGIPRAGDVPQGGPIVLPGLETLDVTALGEEMFGLNHNTFCESRPLIDDIHLILSEGRPAPRLAQERPMPEGGAPKYWRFAP